MYWVVNEILMLGKFMSLSFLPRLSMENGSGENAEVTVTNILLSIAKQLEKRLKKLWQAIFMKASSIFNTF